MWELKQLNQIHYIIYVVEKSESVDWLVGYSGASIIKRTSIFYYEVLFSNYYEKRKKKHVF